MHFSNFRRRKSADLGVPSDDLLVSGKINAKRLVIGNIAFLPLDVGPQLAQDFVRLRRRGAQLLAFECADALIDRSGLRRFCSSRWALN